MTRKQIGPYRCIVKVVAYYEVEAESLRDARWFWENILKPRALRQNVGCCYSPREATLRKATVIRCSYNTEKRLKGATQQLRSARSDNARPPRVGRR